MWHLLAFGSTSLDASAGNVQLPAIADQAYTRSNSSFQMPVPHHLYWAYAGGVNLSRARFQTGSLRSKGFPQVWPVYGAVVPPATNTVNRYTNWPISLRQEEDFRCDITNAAAAEAVVLAAISPNVLNYNVNVRDLRILRFTAAVTLVADAWAALAAFSFEDVLEGGTYQVYGMMTQATNLVAARIVFPNAPQLRPGCIAEASVANVNDYDLWMGGMGKWGEFTTYALPQLEAYGTTAGAQTVEGRLLVGKP